MGFDNVSAQLSLFAIVIFSRSTLATRNLNSEGPLQAQMHGCTDAQMGARTMKVL